MCIFGLYNVLFCIRVIFVICGLVNMCMCVCVCGLCTVWVCICFGFVIFGSVHVCFFVICGCLFVCVL